MQTSCGVLILNEHNELLMGHATGNKFFDIPKGMLEENESPLACAIRECKEETSLDLRNNILIELGLFKYNTKKNLHLFICTVKKENIIIKDLVCNSFFTNFYTKKLQPEVDFFEWINVDEVKIKCAKSLGVLLSNLKENNILNHNIYINNLKKIKPI